MSLSFRGARINRVKFRIYEVAGRYRGAELLQTTDLDEAAKCVADTMAERPEITLAVSYRGGKVWDSAEDAHDFDNVRDELEGWQIALDADQAHWNDGYDVPGRH